MKIVTSDEMRRLDREAVDTYGIPVVTSSVDFAGAFALVLAIVALGVG